MKVLSSFNKHIRRRVAGVAFDFGNWVQASTFPQPDETPYGTAKVVELTVAFEVFSEAELEEFDKQIFDYIGDLLVPRMWVGGAKILKDEDNDRL